MNLTRAYYFSHVGKGRVWHVQEGLLYWIDRMNVEVTSERLGDATPLSPEG